MVAFCAVSMAPDLDVWAFRLGIPYEAPFGHRGASHSLLVALGVGLLIWALHRPGASAGRGRVAVALVATLVVMSHGLLDTMTFGGGHGVALLWPFDATRLWAPLRVIPVSTIGFGVLSPYGLGVLATELVLFSPFWIYGLGLGRRLARPLGYLKRLISPLARRA